MRILSLDGGGIRGVFSARLLFRIEEEIQVPLKQCFDMLAGTSTGALIAGSIITGNPMADLVQFYRDFGQHVFQRKSRLGLFHTVYDHSALKEVLQERIGRVFLGDVSQPLLIPSVNYKHGSIHIFRSGFSRKGMRDAHVPLIDAVLSSCSAPVYFPPHVIKHTYLAGDGGLWANNPALVCLTEAIEVFNKELSDIYILSIGTGKQQVTLAQQGADLQRWGISKWLTFRLVPFRMKPKLVDLALHLSSESITYQCQTLCQERFLRLNTDLGTEISFDDWRQVDHLIQLADAVYGQQKEAIIDFIQNRSRKTFSNSN